ncbi:2-dehydropantoate 2-reductase [Evansella cellulosilytica]|uniref:2-dehydropantoate 2-reductase n=1 Tax=Evansella cellulosilytica (strain ATCC 21833 / DSM 2522 / FERM P-1141 / JCM 9156 / N-4) TaxID=649639 RepID=E6TTU2_EVAC2|nr:2-dehydropantoate 2-reductase [Evansella cellulosilytica]ADU30861.1 2-dehydropantoate 2-reductase [Evansella cellulosilytica DSM 2522]
MKVVVFGGGAIGLLCAVYFSKSGYDVTLVTRSEKQRKIIMENGITLNEPPSYKVRVNVECFEEYTNVDPNDLWIVATKQSGIPIFLKKWQGVKRLPPIIFLQNGMGHLDMAKENLSTDIYAGVVTHGAMKINSYTVSHTGVGKISIGSITGGSSPFCVLKSEKQFPIIYVDNIMYLIKQKLLINLVINPLTAMYSVKNGELLQDNFSHNVKKLFDEGRTILQLCENEWETVLEVIKNTAKNESSMYRDIRNNTKTEIESITGYLLKEAEKSGVQVPIISFVHHSILGLERRR